MQRYEMTTEELDALRKAASTPGVFVGGILKGYDPARAASERVWREMGRKYGFDWRSVRGPDSGEPKTVFYAKPAADREE
jgi:hypothetical protein